MEAPNTKEKACYSDLINGNGFPLLPLTSLKIGLRDWTEWDWTEGHGLRVKSLICDYHGLGNHNSKT